MNRQQWHFTQPAVTHSSAGFHMQNKQTAVALHTTCCNTLQCRVPPAEPMNRQQWHSHIPCYITQQCRVPPAEPMNRQQWHSNIPCYITQQCTAQLTLFDLAKQQLTVMASVAVVMFFTSLSARLASHNSVAPQNLSWS